MNTKHISVIGLGYVGLPVAVSMAKKFKVTGFDINQSRINELNSFFDKTNEVSESDLKNTNLKFTTDASLLQSADFYIVTVPTPIDDANKPDLTALEKASETVGLNLKKGDVVVYESTVYPGLTEEICVPILERKSNLKYKIDFKVGYSPERINPGDPNHRFETIKKVVSGCDEKALQQIAETYGAIVTAGIYKATSIAVAEAAKVIENTQRDLNIALINELSIIFNKMNIDTIDVLEAAGTKWNFLPFRPGLVGGHCIGVDPYYLTYQSEKFGYIPQVILSGRRINDSMGQYVTDAIIKKLCQHDVHVKNSRVAICGITFKENCPDIRNSKVIDIIRNLKEFGVEVVVTDPCADSDEVFHEYGIRLENFESIQDCDSIVFAVAHSDYKSLSHDQILNKLKIKKLVFDIKNIFNKKELEARGVVYWRL